MDSWGRFDGRLLPDKNAFYSELNLEDINDEEYIFAQKVLEEFKLKNLGIIMTCMFKVIHFCLQMYLKTLENMAIFHFQLKERKSKNVMSLFATYITKKIMLFT